MAAGQNKVATTNAGYAIALGRAFAGALIFCLPLLMTMEMWWLGFYMRPLMLAQFSLAHMVVLFGLSRVAGFEASHSALDDVLDAFAAYAVAVITTAALLWMLGAFRPGMTAGEAMGMVAIQSVPASYGAMIGARLLGDGDAIEEQETWRKTYHGQLFLMLAGALFLGFTVAPTEEIILIAVQMGAWHGLALVALSIALLHAILYVVGFPGQHRRALPTLGALTRHTLPGYAIAFVAGIYILWSFGRIDGLHTDQAVAIALVLAFPGAIGAGLARIVV